MVLDNQIAQSVANQVADKPAEPSAPAKVMIYEMPERFRSHLVDKEESKKAGLIILVGAIVLLGLFSTAWFYIMNRKAPVKSGADDQNNIQSPAATSSEAAKEQGDSPKTRYLKMNNNIIEASSLDVIFNVLREYNSARRNSQLSIVLEALISATDEQKSSLLSMEKINSIPSSDVADIREDIQGQSAIVNISTKTGRQGVVNYVIENGEWKIDNEAWQDGTSIESMIASVMASSTQVATTTATSTPETATSTTATSTPIVGEVMFQPAADIDNDGLTDKEESAIGTVSDKADSDDDGYQDGAELANGYNPAGSGKLVDNKHFSSYDNTLYGYSAAYPTDWDIVKADGENSIIIKAPNGQMFQIVVQANQDHESITDWYREQFSVASINQADLVSGDGWQGVKSANGLNVFLADSKTENIFVLSYNLADQSTGDYINFFDYLVKSFKITG